MNTDTTVLSTNVNTATLAKVRSDWDEMMEMGANLSAAKIKFVNLGREIGLHLQGLCQHKQMAMSFFENIKGDLPANMTFSAAQKCIHLANALPKPIKTLAEATHCETQLFLAGGWLEEPRREVAHKSHETSIYVAVFETLAQAKERLYDKFDDVADWDDQTKESVLKELEKFEQAIDEFKSKL